MEFTIFYQILTKKMKSKIEADTELDALTKLKESFKIIKIEQGDENLEYLKKMFGIK